ncbi:MULTISPECIES: ABC transporter permease [unclassified Devosia]|uniref:ABC transporter permease n=1 Tax=unclassified Devosia TaxID=196773 RepID=UPI0008697A3A|nr:MULTISPECIES: ABC transporter permease [unclassified Devosia]MBN9360064.1 ABC transporter permease [Devosia sp.]ODS86722.1 MAG: ABC transporter permease [Devosia sp. SCN 66-27]OJX22121.1 MAG: ABC transporter permease [Devosia sp. 66-14]
MRAVAASAPRSRGSATLWLGLLLVGLHVAVALLTLVWTPYDPTALTGGRLAPPSWEHWAGTDRLGRDFFTQIMIGSRIALIVGISAVAIGGLIGVTLGVLAAFATRLLDDALAATLDILIAFPTLLIAMLVVAASDTASLGTAILALGIALSAIVARLTRILAKRVLLMDYITAARTSGTSRIGVVFQHVLPNIWPTLSVNFALQFGLAVIAEASLSYLGLGAPPPNASWGRLLQEAQGTVYTAPIGAIAPGIALVSLVIGVNLLADGLRDIGDPTRRASR